MDNDDCLVLNLMASFVPYSILDVDRWTAIVALGPAHCQTPFDSLIEIARKVAFRWLEVREVVEEDFAEETQTLVLVVAVAAVRYFGFVSKFRTVHCCRRMLLEI